MQLENASTSGIAEEIGESRGTFKSNGCLTKFLRLSFSLLDYKEGGWLNGM